MLGAETGRAVGLAVPRARLAILAAAAALTGAATLPVGPLSFVGLMAPHLAREIGIQRPTAQLVAEGAPRTLMSPEVLTRIYGIEMGVMPHPDTGLPLSFVRRR